MNRIYTEPPFYFDEIATVTTYGDWVEVSNFTIFNQETGLGIDIGSNNCTIENNNLIGGNPIIRNRGNFTKIISRSEEHTSELQSH